MPISSLKHFPLLQHAGEKTVKLVALSERRGIVLLLHFHKKEGRRHIIRSLSGISPRVLFLLGEKTSEKRAKKGEEKDSASESKEVWIGSYIRCWALWLQDSRRDGLARTQVRQLEQKAHFHWTHSWILPKLRQNSAVSAEHNGFGESANFNSSIFPISHTPGCS